jgi:hypothetical protein
MNVTAVIAASFALAVTAPAPHAWLDAGQPAGWNARVPMPSAPPFRLDDRIVPGGKDPELLRGGRCAGTVRPPRTAPERMVAARGWFIGRVVPPLPSSTSWAVVMGISDADGMCRPFGYQLFAFASGKYVGTLSPQVMNARTDASFVSLRPTSPSTLEVDFLRYSDADPLCCPHATTRVSFGLTKNRFTSVAPYATKTTPNSR